ncbi:ADAM2 [Cervus elaphus hippelaphus]|uniref:ADAM2 n=1 Tax=Cervus elaphus hippelaphus TaxID=46360 RepID=A0A212C308_CEREH|nr:ADAM2 [Cervus elaphus hippelaphus]
MKEAVRVYGYSGTGSMKPLEQQFQVHLMLHQSVSSNLILWLISLGTAVNVKCGKLLCTYDKSQVFTIPNASVLYSNVNGNLCVGLDYAYGDENSAKMWIKDGTVCGERKKLANRTSHADPLGHLLESGKTHLMPSSPPKCLSSKTFPKEILLLPSQLYSPHVDLAM